MRTTIAISFEKARNAQGNYPITPIALRAVMQINGSAVLMQIVPAEAAG
jgi:hypothetical protein